MVVSWQKAFTLYLLGKAEIVEAYERPIRTLTASFDRPAVAKLLRYVRSPAVGVRFSRQNVYLRDGYRCQYCGKVFEAVELTLDHVIPRRAGGVTSWENVVTACGRCNRRKGGRGPEDGIAPMVKPRRPEFIVTHGLKSPGAEMPSIWHEYLGKAKIQVLAVCGE